VSDAAESLARELSGISALGIILPHETDWMAILSSRGPPAHALRVTAIKHAILVAVTAIIWEPFPENNIYNSRPSSLVQCTSEEELRLSLQVEKIRAHYFFDLLQRFKHDAPGNTASGCRTSRYLNLLQHYKTGVLWALSAGVPQYYAPRSGDQLAVNHLLQYETGDSRSLLSTVPEIKAAVEQLVESALECSIIVSVMHTRLFKLHVPGFGITEGAAAAAVGPAAAAPQPVNAWEKRKHPETIESSRGVVQVNPSVMSVGTRFAPSVQAMPGSWALFCQQPGVIKLADSVQQLPGLLPVSSAGAALSGTGLAEKGVKAEAGAACVQEGGSGRHTAVTANIKARVCIVSKK
jgi:hypothetical protein